LLARAGFNAKVGTDASYNEAKLRKDDMESLIQGNQLQLNKNADPPQWIKVSGRPPLMSRMEQAHKEGLAIWTANSADFAKNSEQLVHEAQILAAIAEVIQREGFEFADDEDYLKLAQQVRDNSLRVVEAAKQKKYDQARTATGEIGKACTACHEGYRS
jgi:cytochrome c'